MEKGIKTLGELAAVSQGQLSEIDGVGDYGSHLIVKLLLERGIRGEQAQSYCVKCGAPLDKRVDFRERNVKCPNCKAEFEVQLLKSSAAHSYLR